MILPLILKKELKNLRFFALFGFFTISYICILIVMYSFIPSVTDVEVNFPKLNYFVPSGIFTTFPLFIFSYTCQQNVLQAFQELNTPNERRMKKVVTRQIFLCSVLYLFVGIFGYITYPDEAPDGSGNLLTRYDVTKHLPILIVKNHLFLNSFLPIYRPLGS